MSMAIASDADETSTGGSGNPVENEDTKMLADSSGSNQLDCTVHHYYEKLKDFAFDMPGGWTDTTISIFIDTFKQYKDDFSRPHSDELKIWQKIVKRCVERSNNHKVFTVNSVMELAGSLKSHVLRNEYRKDDETFKMLYNDVVDIIPYFPNTTCDSVSQNLRLRSRSTPHEVKAFASPIEASPSKKSLKTDVLIIKYCEELNLKKESYWSNHNWNRMSKMILENHRLKIDVKKYLGELKRKTAKAVLAEADPSKRRALFSEMLGDYLPYFDLIPPRTIKTEEFIKISKYSSSNGVGGESSSDEQVETNVPDKGSEVVADGQKINKRTKPKVGVDGFDEQDPYQKTRKIAESDEHHDSSESDEPSGGVKSGLRRSSRHRLQSEDLPSDSVTSPETDVLDVEHGSSIENSRKQQSPKKMVNSENHSQNKDSNYSSYKFARMPEGVSIGRSQKPNQSSDDESSSSSRVGAAALKRPISHYDDTPEGSPSTSSDKSTPVLSQNSKHPKLDSDRPPSNENQIDQDTVLNSQVKVESTSLKEQYSRSANRRQYGRGERKVDISDEDVDESIDRNKKRVNFDLRSMDSPVYHVSSVGGFDEINSGSADGDPQPDAKVSASTSGSTEKIKSKNIVTPIHVKVTELVRQEASTSGASSESYPRTENGVQTLSRKSVTKDFNRLERLDENTVKIIEGYKEKVKDAGHSVMQLIPKQHAHVAIPHASLANTSSSVEADLPQPLILGKPPGWFDAFISDYKKHEMWKMHQLLKMQQELVDMENRKLNVLEKILSSINDRKS